MPVAETRTDEGLAEAKVMLLRSFARRCGVHLALAALTLQLALSFGHFHLRDADCSDVHCLRTDIDAGQHGPAIFDAWKQSPSRLADDEEHCTICFSTYLLSISFVLDLPHHLLSSGFANVDRSFDLAFAFDQHRTPFQSRAPPRG
jgi:hypothetical protein